jgi:hypothetical protein
MYQSTPDNAMSKELLPEKLSRDQGLGPGSLPIMNDTNKGKKERHKAIFLIAVGIGTVVLASIVLTPYLNSLGDSIYGGKSSITDNVSTMLEPTAPLEPSFKATDGAGSEIDIRKGAATSEQISISGYSDRLFSTQLQCFVDTLPVYCDGGPITFKGIPVGRHQLTIVDPGHGETQITAFEWNTVSN